jgi:glycosyltransferase involved in cell wall biosynthesis
MFHNRIAIVTNIPTPYRRDLFVKLSASEKFMCKVFFTANTEQSKLWNHADFLDYPHVFVPGRSIKRKDGLATYINLSLLYYLKEYSPDIIIVGGASIPALLCIIYKKLFSGRVFIWWAGTFLSESKKSGVIGIFRKWLFKRTDGFLAYSHLSEQYLKSFNTRSNTVTLIGNNTLDSERYAYEVRKYKDKQSRKVSDDFIMLIVSQLIHRKNIMFVLETFSLLSHKYPNIILKIAGKGPEEASLKAYCSENNLNNVYFLGNVQPQDLKKYYAEADILVSIAHMDQWPQVVNEAMSCGVPVIASTTSGIDNDFLQDGINGYLVDPMDKEKLLHRLEYLLLNPEQAKLMGKEAYRIARAHDVHHVIQCIEKVLLNENSSHP